MAYMSQEKKAKIAAALKNVVPKDWKYSLSVYHHSTIVMTIKSAPLNLVDIYTSKEYNEDSRQYALKDMHADINPYHWKSHFDGELARVFGAIFAALNLDNHDNSDSMTDYFDVGHYVDVDLGKWNKPFVVTQAKSASKPVVEQPAKTFAERCMFNAG